MALCQFVYPKPEVIGSLEPEFFHGVREQMAGLTQADIDVIASLELQLVNGVFRISDSYDGDGLLEQAEHLADVTMSQHPDPKRVNTARIVFRMNEMWNTLGWHRDGIGKRGLATVVADKHTTLFAHGIRIGLDYIHSHDQGAKAAKIAKGLSIFRTNPYEIALFDSRMLHSKPAEDLEDRIFIRTTVS